MCGFNDAYNNWLSNFGLVRVVAAHQGDLGQPACRGRWLALVLTCQSLACWRYLCCQTAAQPWKERMQTPGGLPVSSVRRWETRLETSLPCTDVSSDVTRQRREITSHYNYRRLSAERVRSDGLDSLFCSVFRFLIQGELYFFSSCVWTSSQKKHGALPLSASASLNENKTPRFRENESYWALEVTLAEKGWLVGGCERRTSGGENKKIFLKRYNCWCCSLERRMRSRQAPVGVSLLTWCLNRH